ncbi:MAG: O-antigen ligase family protein [Pontixanthobacter sp.]
MKMLRGETAQVPAAGWIGLALFAIVLALLGGSSRPDAVQNAGLLPLAALFLVPALYYIDRRDLAKFKLPLLLIGAWTAWTALQLVPLPPAIWHALPGREPVEQLDSLLSLESAWRPLSMVPSRGFAALFGMIVPVTALLLARSLSSGKQMILIILIAVGSVNTFVGLAQVISGNSQALYFYAISNFGSPVGLFANHNHSAVLSSLTLLTIAYYVTRLEFSSVQTWHRIVLASLFVVTLLVALVGQSRAGLITGFLALCASGSLLWSHRNRPRPGSRKHREAIPLQSSYVIAALVIALVGMIASFALFDRIPALSRVAESGTFEDLRWSLFPIVTEMALKFGILGTGFGSFEHVYHIYEPDSLMLPSYVNQAHNDLAQMIIEGGVPALLLLGAFLFWVFQTLREFLRTGSDSVSKLVYWATVFAIILFASMFDYPLRTPLFQMVAVWLVAIFASERSELRTTA